MGIKRKYGNEKKIRESDENHNTTFFIAYIDYIEYIESISILF